MADTVKSSSELKLEEYYADGDTRTMTLTNPKTNLTAAEINSVGTLAAQTQPIVGDKGGADFVRFTRARIVDKTEVKLDLR